MRIWIFRLNYHTFKRNGWLDLDVIYVLSLTNCYSEITHRPKGWHKSISATESHDPGVRIGDTVITRLNDDGILVDEEEEPLIESMDDHNVHEMENVGDNMWRLTSCFACV